MSDHPTSRERATRSASGPLGWFLEHRRSFIVLFHLGLVALSSYVAIWLRFDGVIPTQNWEPWLRTLPWLLLVRALTFAWFGLYQGPWRYTGIWDLRNIVSAVVLSSLAHYLLVHWALGWTGYPRAVFIIDSGVLVLLMGGVRMIRRIVTELRHTSGARRVLVYGAGDAGEMIVRDMRTKPSQPYRPIGFIDDDKAKVGQRIHGVPVLGVRKCRDVGSGAGRQARGGADAGGIRGRAQAGARGGVPPELLRRAPAARTGEIAEARIFGWRNAWDAH